MKSSSDEIIRTLLVSNITGVLERREKFGEFPGGAVDKARSSQCRGPGLGN